MATQYCSEPGCSNRVAKGRCAAHARDREGRRPNLELRKLYHTARWCRLRAVVLAEQPFCPECDAEGVTVASRDVHHREKATPDNFFVQANLQALCIRHHSLHTARG